MQRRFVGLWIPAELLEDERLTIHEKIMAAEIDALDRPVEGCTAKNEHFEGRLNLGNSRIKEILKRLTDLKLVESENPTGKQRVLRSRLADFVAERRREGGVADTEQGPAEEVFGGPPCDPRQNDTGRDPGHPPAGIPATPSPHTSIKENTVESTPPIGGMLPGPGPAVLRPPSTGQGRKRGRPATKPTSTEGLFGTLEPAAPVGPTADEIYAAYPRQIEREKAMEQIRLAIFREADRFKREGNPHPDKAAREFLLAVTQEWAAAWAPRIAAEGAEGKRGIIYPQRFYRDSRWTDDRTEWKTIASDFGRFPRAGGYAPPGRNGNGYHGNGGGRVQPTPEQRGQFAETGDYSGITFRAGSGGNLDAFGPHDPGPTGGN
jgi:hypothetical protein